MLADDGHDRLRVRVAEADGDQMALDCLVLLAPVGVEAGSFLGEPGLCLVIGRLHVEEGARHHRHGRGHRAGRAASSSVWEFGAEKATPKTRPKIETVPSSHAEHDRAGRGDEGTPDPSEQCPGPIRRAVVLRTAIRRGVIVLNTGGHRVMRLFLPDASHYSPVHSGSMFGAKATAYPIIAARYKAPRVAVIARVNGTTASAVLAMLGRPGGLADKERQSAA
jgi:hypothetical protein